MKNKLVFVLFSTLQFATYNSIAGNTHYYQESWDTTYVLSRDRSDCPNGWGLAGKLKNILGEMKWVETMCYQVDEKKGKVKLVPINSINPFSGITIDASLFEKIR